MTDEIEQPFTVDRSKLFRRYDCQSCVSDRKLVAVFKIIQSRICLVCYDRTKKASGLSCDEIHELDIKQVKKYLTPAKEALVKNEKPAAPEREVHRDPGDVKADIR